MTTNDGIDRDAERIQRALYEHRLAPGTADACHYGCPTYSTPGYWEHLFYVALALHADPELDRVRYWNVENARNLRATIPAAVPQADTD